MLPGDILARMLADFKVAFQALVRQPVLSIVALATLVLGIGANTAIFSLVKGVWLDALPYEASEELVVLREQKPQGGTDSVSPPTYVDWKARTSTIVSMAAFRHVRYGFRAADEPLDLPSLRATPELFDVLRSSALMGRTFTEEEGTPGMDKVAVLSHGMWQRHFGSDRGVLGRPIELDAVLYTVVGVMGEDFAFPPGNDINLWTPLAFDPNDAHGRSRQARSLSVVGRLKSSTRVQQAREEMSAIAAALADEYPDTNLGWGAVTESAHEQTVQTTRPALLILLAAVGFLLLIVCANVASLMLARLATRRREVALRAALGAGRFALMRQVMAESILLAGAGAMLGLGVAWFGIRIARNLPVANVPRLDQIGLDGGVLLFTAVVSVVVALGFGLLPAMRASSPQLRDSLNENSRGGSLRARRALNVIVVVKVALALVLLIGAGLTIRSFREMMSVDPGFRPDHVMATQNLFAPSEVPRARRAPALFPRHPRAASSDSGDRVRGRGEHAADASRWDRFRFAVYHRRSKPTSFLRGAACRYPGGDRGVLRDHENPSVAGTGDRTPRPGRLPACRSDQRNVGETLFRGRRPSG